MTQRKTNPNAVTVLYKTNNIQILFRDLDPVEGSGNPDLEDKAKEENGSLV
jgi:hypothetical protein